MEFVALFQVLARGATGRRMCEYKQPLIRHPERFTYVDLDSEISRLLLKTKSLNSVIFGMHQGLR